MVQTRKTRWTSKTLFPVKIIGKPYLDPTGDLVALIHYLGFSKRFDEVRPVRELVPLTSMF